MAKSLNKDAGQAQAHQSREDEQEEFRLYFMTMDQHDLLFTRGSCHYCCNIVKKNFKASFFHKKADFIQCAI